jgi:hypothetical protein
MNEDKKAYLEEKVNGYLEPMLIALLNERPADSLGYMKKWLQTNGQKIQEEEKSNRQDFERKADRTGR